MPSRRLVSFAGSMAAVLASCGQANPPSADAAASATDAQDAASFDTAGRLILDTVVSADSEPDSAPDTGPPVLDVVLDGATLPDSAGCTPSCKGKVCGPNGCGSVCGFCKSGEFCSADGAKCQGFCEKNCKDKACGSDGCNGLCGTCDKGFACGDDFKCYADACQGSCAGKVCGDNGCGKSCGVCAGSDYCDAGACVANACKGVDPQKGNCEGDLLLTCTGTGAAAKKLVKDCAAPPNLQNLTCGWDAAANKNACIAKACDPSCTTDGEKMVCGNNACGQPCGTCPDGWKCNVTSCAPAEGASCTPTNFPPEGQCSGGVWIYCNTGKLKFVDCKAAGMDKCGWNAAAGKFECL